MPGVPGDGIFGRNHRVEIDHGHTNPENVQSQADSVKFSDTLPRPTRDFYRVSPDWRNIVAIARPGHHSEYFKGYFK
jgi:hypothetical protein